MKKIYLLLLPLLLLASSCSLDTSNSADEEERGDSVPIPEEAPETTAAPARADTFVLGNMSAAQKNIDAVVIAPKLKPATGDATECEGDCVSVIKFGEALPELRHDSSIGGRVFNVGDLDNDGTSEILFVPDWFSSCWSSLVVYSLKNGAWKELGIGSVYTCQKTNYTGRIKKGNAKTFTIVEDTFGEDGQILQQEKKISLTGNQ